MLKSYLQLLPKKVFAAVATVALVAGMASSAIAGFGPDRPTKAWSDGLNGFDHVTFNSFTGVPAGIGDERNFLRGVQVGRDSVWSDPVTSVTNNAEVEVKIYIHNNASSSLNDQPGNPGVAKNVQVRAALPTGIAQAQQITSYISADNAQPKQIFDTLDITGSNASAFELAYVAGSAKMFNHENGQTTAISDTLVTSGVTLPDQKGCFEYVREITFRVKVKNPSYNVKKQVRFEGQTKNDWKEDLNVKPGQTVEWKIEFTNTGSTLLKEVVLLDQLPAGLTVVPGSVKLIDGNYPNGYVFGPEAVQNNGRQINIKIGDVNPGINSIIAFLTKVDTANVKCGVNKLVNSGYATPKDFGTIKDDASVSVDGGKCEEPQGPTYVCESLNVEKLGGRKVRATVKSAITGQNVTAKNAVINYGDGSTAKTTNNKVNGNFVDEYEYKADGTYKVTASVVFTVNGVDQTAKTSDNCAKMVTFGSVTELPKTGAGSLVGLFAGVSALGAAAHNLISRRRAL